MTSHTPGPWSIRTKQNLTAICTPKGEMQLSLHGVYDGLKPLTVSVQEWHANAALIAAAPEMLEAIKKLADLQRKWRSDNEKKTIDSIEYMNEIDNILWTDIIAKAEGGVK